MAQPPYIYGNLGILRTMKHGLANVIAFTDSFWSRASTTVGSGNYVHQEFNRQFKPDAWAGVVDNSLSEAVLPMWVNSDAGSGTGVVGTQTRNPWDAAGNAGLTQWSPHTTRETQFNNTTLTGDILCMRRYLNAANGFPWPGGAWYSGQTLTARVIYYQHANGLNGLQLKAFSPTIGTLSSPATVNQRNASAAVAYADVTIPAGTIGPTSLTGIDLRALSGSTFSNNSFFTGIGLRLFNPSTSGLQFDFCGFSGMYMQRLLDMISSANLQAYQTATGANIIYIPVGRNDLGQGETATTYGNKLVTFMGQFNAGTQYVLQSPHSNTTDDAWLAQVAAKMKAITLSRSDAVYLDGYNGFADATLNDAAYLENSPPLHFNGIGATAFAARVVGWVDEGASAANPIDVRLGTVYGSGLGLTGTLATPAASSAATPFVVAGIEGVSTGENIVAVLYDASGSVEVWEPLTEDATIPGRYSFRGTETLTDSLILPKEIEVRSCTAKTLVAFNNVTNRADIRVERQPYDWFGGGYLRGGVWTSTPGSGSIGLGTGDTAVDHNTGGTDNLKFEVTSGTNVTGIDGADVRAYLASDYTAGRRSTAYVKGQTETGPVGGVSGRMPSPMYLQSNSGSNTYTIEFNGAGYQTATTTIAI